MLCGKIQTYKRKDNKIRAEKRNINCNSCSKQGKKYSQEVNKKKGKCGKNNSMYGKSVYSIWLEKYGKEKADKMWEEKNKKMRESLKGRTYSEESIKKMRLSRIKEIKNKYGQCLPNYNSEACKLIDGYNKRHGFNFQHAENGGEINIDGYFPDGIDEKKKVIIEVDEAHHFDKDGNLKKKDVVRQQYLEGMGYKFIRIKI